MDSPNLDRALRLKSNAARGGVIENIFMRNVKIGQVTEAVLTIDLLYEEGAHGRIPPVVRNIQLDNVTSAGQPAGVVYPGFRRRHDRREIRLSDSTFDGVDRHEVVSGAGRIAFERRDDHPRRAASRSRNTIATAREPTHEPMQLLTAALHPHRSTRYRWVVCALLFFATTINYIDRQILSLLKPMLDKELDWTNAQFGLVNSVFPGAYAVGPAGLRLVRRPLRHEDRLRRLDRRVEPRGDRPRAGRRASAASSLRAWRSGSAKAGTFPPPIKAIALWFPKRERAFATAPLQFRRQRRRDRRARRSCPLIALHFGWHWAVRRRRASPASSGSFSGGSLYEVPDRSQAGQRGRAGATSAAIRDEAAQEATRSPGAPAPLSGRRGPSSSPRS